MNKKKISIFTLIFLASLGGGCSSVYPKSIQAVKVQEKKIEKKTEKINEVNINKTVPITIVNRPISWSENREKLIREYAQIHYNKNITRIIPQVVVIHWTALEDCVGVYQYFYNETMEDDGGGRLNVASHFLVDKDGTIYALTPENALNRHAIGYNWCAIGIENVGGSEGKENLTAAQTRANIDLIKYLKSKYPTIEYVWGHYQQNEAKASGLFIEKVPDYYADKIDPGEKFMLQLKAGLKKEKLRFYI
jgi:N-acetyl-anhydromuramyl-L-alanine amidase AmpD